MPKYSELLRDDLIEFRELNGIDIEQVKIPTPPGPTEIIEQLREMLGEMVDWHLSSSSSPLGTVS